jgi:DNA transformation protein
LPLAAGFRDYLFEILTPLGRIEFKRVFGLDGIKADGALLGFVIEEKVHFRTDEESVAAYKSEGGKPFTFTKRNGEFIVTSYYSIPDRLMDEPGEFLLWARRAREAALKAPSAVKRRAKRERKARVRALQQSKTDRKARRG